MIHYSLKEIAKIVDGQLIGEENVMVDGLQYDSRLMKENYIFAPFVGEKNDGHKFVSELFNKGVKASFWQSDCKLEKPEGNLIVVKSVHKAMIKLAKYYRDSLDITIVGVTGSSGKTSTKDIVASVLSQKYKVYKTIGNKNNIIGVPLTLINMADDIDVAVIEMGIDDIGIMDRLADMVKPDYTIITSIAPAHIQQFKTLDKIVEQKCLINKNLKENGCCYYNVDCYGVKEQLAKMNLDKQSFCYGFEKADVVASDYYMSDSYTYFKVNGKQFRVHALGKVQVLNSLAAMMVGLELNMSEEEIQKGLESVKLTDRRMQVKELDKGTIIDDSYNSNPSSLVSSLNTFIEYQSKLNKIVVLGDMLELGEDSINMHKKIADLVDFNNFKQVILVGQQMSYLHKYLKEKNIESKWFINYLEAVETVKEVVNKENIVFFKSSNSMKFNELILSLEETK